MAALHDAPHPQAGETVTLGDGCAAGSPGDPAPGVEFVVEDWWDRLTGSSWGVAQGNPAALKYAMRAGLGGLPVDDEVVYGKIRGLGHIVHVSELV
jgi:hypothetical protein